MHRVAELDVDHLAREQERRSEDPRLLVGALRELGPAQPTREAEVVADAGARACLAADRLALDDERAQSFRGCIDRRGESRRAGPDDHDVELAGLVELSSHPGPVLREILRLRVDERRPVRKDDHWNVGSGLPAGAEQLDSLGRIAGMECMRHAVSREEIAQLVAARRPGIGHHGELPSPRRVLPTPLLQKLRDEAVEELIGSAPGLERVVVDVPERHRRPDRVRGLLVGPASPRDEKRSLRVRMDVVNALEKVLTLQVRSPTRRHDDRDGGVAVAKRLELSERSLGRRPADHAVVARVALELARDPLERIRVFVHRQDEGKLGHHSERYAASRHSPSSPFNVCVPRSSNASPAVPVSARVRSETRISSAPAAAMILAAS